MKELEDPTAWLKPRSPKQQATKQQQVSSTPVAKKTATHVAHGKYYITRDTKLHVFYGLLAVPFERQAGQVTQACKLS